MARASAIWVVKKGNFVIGAFTVKHELVRWLTTNVAKYKWQNYEISIIRCQDGNPDTQHEYYSIEDILNG
jgi:hypothetical protein